MFTVFINSELFEHNTTKRYIFFKKKRLYSRINETIFVNHPNKAKFNCYFMWDIVGFIIIFLNHFFSLTNQMTDVLYIDTKFFVFKAHKSALLKTWLKFPLSLNCYFSWYLLDGYLFGFSSPHNYGLKLGSLQKKRHQPHS